MQAILRYGILELVIPIFRLHYLAMNKTIAIIGAGISGLTCAYELQKQGFEVVVFEKNDYVGGRMTSRDKDGLIFDTGADHLTNNYTQMKEYCQELGVDWEPMRFLKYNVWRNGKLAEPKDTVSMWARMWLGLQWYRTPKDLDYFDLSQAVQYDTEPGYDFVKRRMGQEVSDYFFDPYCATYQFHLSKDISKTGIVASMCSLKYEKKGWYLQRTKGGMRALPEALASKLDVRLGTAVIGVRSEEGAVTVETEAGEECFAAVVLASTANVTRKIYTNPTEAQEQILEQVQYAATISTCFRVDVDRLPEDVSTVWVPFVENEKVSAYINETYKGEELIKDGKSAVSVWIHEEFAQEIIDKSDEEIFSAVKEEFLKVCPWFDHAEQVENFDLERWPAAMPKFSHGQVTRVHQFLQSGQGQQMVWLCGDYLNSPWTEGALRCGQRVAQQVSAQLRSGDDPGQPRSLHHRTQPDLRSSDRQLDPYTSSPRQ